MEFLCSLLIESSSNRIIEYTRSVGNKVGVIGGLYIIFINISLEFLPILIAAQLTDKFIFSQLLFVGDTVILPADISKGEIINPLFFEVT